MADVPGPRPGEDARPQADWLYALTAAESVTDVVAVARDYAATWTPLQLSRIPAACRPGRIGNANDVSELAYKLTRAHLTFTASVTDWLLLERMMNFFVQASTRIAELHAASRGWTGAIPLVGDPEDA